MSEVNYMNECMTRDIVTMLVEQRGMAIADAMELFYNSRTYEKLNNTKTGLYFQSPVYVFDVLEKEIEKEKQKM